MRHAHSPTAPDAPKLPPPSRLRSLVTLCRHPVVTAHRFPCWGRATVMALPLALALGACQDTIVSIQHKNAWVASVPASAAALNYDGESCHFLASGERIDEYDGFVYREPRDVPPPPISGGQIVDLWNDDDDIDDDIIMWTCPNISLEEVWFVLAGAEEVVADFYLWQAPGTLVGGYLVYTGAVPTEDNEREDGWPKVLELQLWTPYLAVSEPVGTAALTVKVCDNPDDNDCLPPGS